MWFFFPCYKRYNARESSHIFSVASDSETNDRPGPRTPGTRLNALHQNRGLFVNITIRTIGKGMCNKDWIGPSVLMRFPFTKCSQWASFQHAVI